MKAVFAVIFFALAFSAVSIRPATPSSEIEEAHSNFDREITKTASIIREAERRHSARLASIEISQ